MATNLLTSLFRRAPPQPQPTFHFPYNTKTNPYTCKRPWPPDFAHLSPKHQFRLERRYRRRSKLKYTRPNWNKAMKLAQWGGILFVVGYGVFWLEVGDDEDVGESGKRMRRGRSGTVFDGVRGWWDGGLGGDLASARGDGRREEGEAGERVVEEIHEYRST